MSDTTVKIDQGKFAQSTTETILPLCSRLALDSYLTLPGDETQSVLNARHERALDDWTAFEQSWSRLPLDTYMADGGMYRRRRYATLLAPASTSDLTLIPGQPHYQERMYNSLNGGRPRYFEPIEDVVLTGQTMTSLLTFGCELFGRLAPFSNWHIEVHQFRIEAKGRSPGQPTPEGAHRDGVDFAMMVMVNKVGVSGGATSLYDPEGHPLEEFTLTSRLDLAIVNDERIRHGVSPIAPLRLDRPGSRDVLVVTFRHTTETEVTSGHRLFGALGSRRSMG